MFSSWQGQLQNIQSAVPSFETVRTAIIELQDDSSEPKQKDGQMPFEHEVAFDGVCFTYKNSSEEVLHDVSFVLPCGSVTALAGPSGAGKSTTADLLLGLLRPTKGNICVDGHALQADEQRMWRKSIGYIPQEPLILNATVRENLSRFHPQATEADMIDALKKSLAWPVIEKLPQGLDTVLGDKGIRLSGGERQRIVLARVLMGAPRLIILDEATSALDYESETFVRETIRQLRGKATVLIIAHRLATIRGADRAIVLENGTIAEQGNMEELLERKDGYLWRMLKAE
ncbi:MAG: ABC transporter ATP-binding protein, partial [Oscillospiraceae bacterium]|nr:ABC transporter ATP-binding protein [Oscillospiraceae bacterium]